MDDGRTFMVNGSRFTVNGSYWETNMNNNHNFIHKLIMVHG
jgi:hypothetical protein